MNRDFSHEFVDTVTRQALGGSRKVDNTILIADALPGLRSHAAGIVRHVSTEAMPVVYEATTGTAAVELAKQYKPGLIIMDVALPMLNGIKAAGQIWEANPSAKILFWTQYHREVYIRDLGRIVPRDAIHGYVLKNHSDDKLKHAILSVWKHDNPYIDPEVRKVNTRSSNSGLTDREFETLQDLALGLTEKAISMRRNISIRGVQCRAAALYSKLIPSRHYESPDLGAGEMFNWRARMLFEASKRGLIETESLAAWDKELDSWLRTEFGVE